MKMLCKHMDIFYLFIHALSVPEHLDLSLLILQSEYRLDCFIFYPILAKHYNWEKISIFYDNYFLLSSLPQFVEETLHVGGTLLHCAILQSCIEVFKICVPLSPFHCFWLIIQEQSNLSAANLDIFSCDFVCIGACLHSLFEQCLCSPVTLWSLILQ